MQRVRVSVVFILSLAYAVATHATVALTGECQNGRIVLEAIGTGVPDDPSRVGFDIYRRPIGQPCGERVRITEDVLANQSGDFRLTFEDQSVSANLMYEYQLVGVDADRAPIDLVSFNWTWRSCGVAPIVLGKVDRPSTPGEYFSVEGTCPQWCNAPGGLISLPADLLALIDSLGPLNVILYGTVEYHIFDGPLMYADSWTFSNCDVVSVEESPWSGIKQLYR